MKKSKNIAEQSLPIQGDHEPIPEDEVKIERVEVSQPRRIISTSPGRTVINTRILNNRVSAPPVPERTIVRTLSIEERQFLELQERVKIL